MFEPAAEQVFAAILGTQRSTVRITRSMIYRERPPEQCLPGHCGIFYLIGAGPCRVEADYLAQPVTLLGGDLMVFPRGAAHTLRRAEDESGTRAFSCGMLCGEFSSGGRGNLVLQALPDCFVVRDTEGEANFRTLGRILAAEAQLAQFGNQLIQSKLVDSLLTLAIRSHAIAEPPAHGLLAALMDPRLARALAAIHCDCGRDWTLAALAEIANMSRTAFCEHFSGMLDVAPMQYLIEWRMAEALRLLRDPGQSVARIASLLGYRTEAAFRRAFKRVHGFAPGALRRDESSSLPG